MNPQLVYYIPPHAALGRRAGLGELSLPPIHGGARFRMGIEIDDNSLFFATMTITDLTDAIAAALARSGYVSGRPTVSAIAGVIHPFLDIQGVSGREYGSATHLMEAIISVIESIASVDRSSVKFDAETYLPVGPGAQANNGGATPRYPYQADITQYRADQTDPNKKGFLDELAKSLGVTTSDVIALSALGALLLAVVIIKR